MDKKLIGKISRQWTLREQEREDFKSYDNIVNMKWDGIPGVTDKPWGFCFKDPTGRDLIQQATNIYSTQKPKWDVIPIGPNDAERAEKIERVIEWHMLLANEYGKTSPFATMLTHSTKYNKICVQLEHRKNDDGDDYFCPIPFSPSIVVYEVSDEPAWVAVVNNSYAVDILEHWEPYKKDKQIKAALSKIQELVDEDEEQRMMYVDYEDRERRYTFCFKRSDDSIDDTFGFSDDGEPIDDMILVQDKKNTDGYVHWAIAEGEGDPLLAPLHHGDQWLNTNKVESIKASKAFMTAFEPDFLQQGSSTEEPDISYNADQTVIRAPMNATLTKLNHNPLDPAFNELSTQYRNMMTNSVGIGQTASLEAANVQFATINALIQLRLARLEPYKRTFEKASKQLAKLIFKWMIKHQKPLTGYRIEGKPGAPVMMKGAELTVLPEEAKKIFITCELLPNNPTDMMQRVNSFMTMKQGGAPIAWSEIFERLHIGGLMSVSRFEKEEVARTALEAFKAELMSQVELKVKSATLQMETEAQLELASQAGGTTGAGAEPLEQGVDQAAKELAQGQGFNAAQGGNAPSEMSPSLTQTQGNVDFTGAGAG